ncbi:OsmC family protein [Paenibacillus oenotherae]|uniref:OsmC family protein n=1 Tax=Paenibacillus oenotherae TaxID=1435645 RepID=A0ABS7DC13_9BACL|nr:OsmC family protein [Paenibacillus oenotherae]MBW7477309.1 OsmC family protein [Paenibacillus oenotherae]
MSQYQFEVKSSWSGSWNGQGTVQGDSYEGITSMPREMEGPGMGMNSEELMLGAAATCYLVTYSFIADKMKLPIADLSMTTQGQVTAQGGSYDYTKIIHRLNIALSSEATDAQVRLAETLTSRAEKSCMIAKLMRGNVEIVIEPTVSIIESITE